ncbi:hypothetical protein [Burkholderia arboris]|uniref:hypothetical protein n=1 Tax=Burkholderia arboris TaxID=488730 RepID=UPI001CF1EF7F|nr:hypothetical protein [Burkholderia arboris]MCA8492790.1 hypothetical protein [Burkholderia arboris]
MARRKNYKIDSVRQEQFCEDSGKGIVDRYSKIDGARIDMVALLGPTTRFAANQRYLDFNDWLGRGIDAWIWSSLASLRSLLLAGAHETATVATYANSLRKFFAYLTGDYGGLRIATPEDLSPSHIADFVAWLQRHEKNNERYLKSKRTLFNNIKSVLLKMFALGYIPGDPARFFKRGQFPRHSCESRQTSLSEAEQECLAKAIKTDLVAVHHGRLTLYPGDVQALRLLLVAHRQGINPTPLLELRRDAITPGPLPDTICMRTVKNRSRKIRFSTGRVMVGNRDFGSEYNVENGGEVIFALAEGAVLQQAILSTESLVKNAPSQYKNRVWLYESQEIISSKPGRVTCLTASTLAKAVVRLINRHKLIDDNGERLRINLSRIRKSYFDRALRNSDGDLAKTANLMGNTPLVAGLNYPSMNDARKSEAAEFINIDYVDMLRGDVGTLGEEVNKIDVIKIKPVGLNSDGEPALILECTPVSGCTDTLNGEYAPHNGYNHCDRYVMCLFCSSFAIVGTVGELWRLFSFQTFAETELKYLDSMLGPERTSNDILEDLRDRYRVAIPFIDRFSQLQFPAHVVNEARVKAKIGLHPFWTHQMNVSRRARALSFPDQI